MTSSPAEGLFVVRFVTVPVMVAADRDVLAASNNTIVSK